MLITSLYKIDQLLEEIIESKQKSSIILCLGNAATTLR